MTSFNPLLDGSCALYWLPLAETWKDLVWLDDRQGLNERESEEGPIFQSPVWCANNKIMGKNLLV